MRIALNEIWNFIELIDKNGKGWSYNLVAGSTVVEKIDHPTLVKLKNDEDYDTELLPSLFTFREILWQPDVFTETAMSLPGLRILKAYCEETAALMTEESDALHAIYAELVTGLANAAAKAIEQLEENNLSVIKTLRDLRRTGFPIIKFFTYHPQNRLDYHRDAINRLNYAVKVMLTQFHSRYTELEDPYWEVSFEKSSTTKKPADTSLMEEN